MMLIHKTADRYWNHPKYLLFKEGHEEAETDENHDVYILEHWKYLELITYKINYFLN